MLTQDQKYALGFCISKATTEVSKQIRSLREEWDVVCGEGAVSYEDSADRETFCARIREDLRRAEARMAGLVKMEVDLRNGFDGTCTCGEDIGFDRLCIQPTAHLCVPCETRKERAELCRKKKDGFHFIPAYNN